MPRYDGMDEILQRLQTHLSDAGIAPERSQPDMSLLPVPMREEGYAAALERMMLILRDAQELRRLLGDDGIRMLSQTEQDELLEHLGKVLEQLWICEAALNRVPQE